MTVRRAVLCALMATVATAAGAQDLRRAEVTVVAIAGSEVYLDVGSEAGLAAGDTLRVEDRGAVLGHLVVLSVSSATSVAGFAERPFALTRGQRLVVDWTPGLPPPDAAVDEESPPDRISVFDRPPQPTVRRAITAGPHLDGRLHLGSSATWSRVAAPSGHVARGFATPFAGIRARLDGLPAGVYAAVDGRFEYRVRSDTPFDRPGELRLHRFGVGAALGPVELEAGRLRDPHDRFAGSIDGLRLHVGRAERGLGLSAGFEPEWRAGELSTELPRIGLTAHTRFDVADVQGELSVVTGHSMPRSQGLQSRTSGGGQLRLASGTWRVAVDALLDRDPASDALAFSRLVATAQWALSTELSATAHAGRRRTYILAGPLQALRAPSDRAGAGLAYTIPHLGRSTFRLDGAYASGSGAESVSVSVGAAMPRLPVLDVGIDAYGTLWRRRGETGVAASGAVTRYVGSTWFSAGYRLFVSPDPLRPLVVHGAEGAVQVPLATRTSWTVQVAADFSERSTAARIYSGFWIRL